MAQSDYKFLFNALPTAVLILDCNGIVLDVNDRLCEWLDAKSDDIIGRNLFMLRSLPRESKMRILEKFSERLEGEKVSPYEIVFKGKNREPRVGVVSELAATDSKGAIERFVVVMTDITHLKKEEVVSDDENSIYRTVFDHSAVAITVVDENERISSWNKFAEELLGMTPEDLRLRPVSTLYPPEEWQRMRSLNLRQKGPQHHLESKVIRKDGRVVDVKISISLLKDKQGKIKGSIGILRDISERKRAESKASVADSKYQMIFENSAVGIMMADENENIISCNSYTEKLLGWKQEELLSRPVQSLYPTEEWQKIREANVRVQGMLHHFDTKMISKNGNLLDVDISLSVIKDNDGNIKGSIGVIRDITERKLIENEMISAFKLKNEFLSVVSHELKTPLTAIKGSIDIIIAEAAGPLSDEQKDFLSTAMTNTQRLERLINDVLDYQRLEAGRVQFKMVEHDINDLVETIQTTYQQVAQDRGLEFVIDVQEGIAPLIFDENQLSRAVGNIVDNAIKFTDHGIIQLSVSASENFVTLKIKDSGIGIKPEDMDKLFKSFSQVSTGNGRRTGNMGLGLAIAKSIIKSHKGEITFDSEVDKGTEFNISIPIKRS